MAARAKPFEATGDLFTVDNAAGAALPGPGMIDTGSGFQTNQQVVGLSFSGFTSVDVYDAEDETGQLILHCPAPGVYTLEQPIRFTVGIYLDCAGTGKGSVFIGG